METHTTPGRRAPAIGLAWAGIVFAVLYVVGLLLASGSPNTSSSVRHDRGRAAARWADYYGDSGHRWAIVIGAFVLGLAVIALVVFASELRDRLVARGAPTAGRLAFAGAVLFAAFTVAGAAALAWIPGAKQFGDVALPSGDLTYLASQLGFGLMLVGGGFAAALFLVPSGASAARRGLVPAWLGWAGVVVGVVLFFVGAAWLPMWLLALWVLVTAIVLLARRDTSVAASSS